MDKNALKRCETVEMASPPAPGQSPQQPTPKQLKLSPKSDSSGELDGGQQASNLKPSERMKKYLKKKKQEKIEKQKTGEVEKLKVKKNGLKRLRRMKALSETKTPRPENKAEEQEKTERNQEDKVLKAKEGNSKEEEIKPASTNEDEKARNAHKMYMRYWRSMNQSNFVGILNDNPFRGTAPKTFLH